MLQRAWSVWPTFRNGFRPIRIMRGIHSLTLEPYATGFKKWNDTLNSEKERTAVRNVVIHSTPPDFGADLDSYGSEADAWIHWEGGHWPQYTDAIARLAEIPSLENVHVRFTDRCSGYEGTFDDYAEAPSTRVATMQAVFDSLSQRNKLSGMSRVRVLTVENLQNQPADAFTSSAAFQDVTQHLSELHLQVCEQYNEYGPDHDIYHIERQQAEPYIRNQWLLPLADHLASLSVYFREPWGLMPGYFDGRGLEFPKLRRLTLGNYAVAHDDQWDWILRQKSLESLRLDSCIIVPFIYLTDHEMKEWTVRTDGWHQAPRGAFGYDHEDNRVFTYPGTWAAVYHRIRNELPNLVDFRFNPNQNSRHPFLELPYNMECHLRGDHFFARYVPFNIGILPTHWPEPHYPSDTALTFGEGYEDGDLDESGNTAPGVKMSLDRHKDTEKDDTEALNALLTAVTDRQKDASLESLGGLTDGYPGCAGA